MAESRKRLVIGKANSRELEITPRLFLTVYEDGDIILSGAVGEEVTVASEDIPAVVDALESWLLVR